MERLTVGSSFGGYDASVRITPSGYVTLTLGPAIAAFSPAQALALAEQIRALATGARLPEAVS